MEVCMKSVEVKDHSLKEMAEKAGIDAKEIQNELGISRTAVYSILNGKYNGKIEVIEAVQELIERRSEKKIEEFSSQSQVMMNALMGFTLRDNDFSVIAGASGIGKTTAALKFQEQNQNIVYFKIFEGMNYSGVLNALLEKFSRSTDGNNSDKLRRLMDAFKQSPCDMLIIDEADLLVSDSRKNKSFMKKISIFREMHEYAKKAVLLVGLEIIEDELRFASKSYITNRVTSLYSASTPTLEEYVEFWTKVLGMKFTTSVKHLFTQVTEKGCFRILETVAHKAKLLDGDVEMGMQFLFI